MEADGSCPNRRLFLQRLAILGGVWLTTPGLFAEELAAAAQRKLIITPGMTEGPFYPDKMPLDTDNDLLIVNDGITPAVGEVSYVSGRALTASGQPLRNGFVEIWQCDTNGSYRHSRGQNPDGSHDPNFQGYGRFMTGSKGEYLFRTIKPVPYDLAGMYRAPHIHFAVSRNGQRLLTTQMLVRGHPANARDNILGGVRDSSARESVLVDFQPLAGSKIGELSATFDIVLGETAKEDETGKLRGGISGPQRRRRSRP
jgi:protocatechuate 3,4-dioxygenase beta subunit